MLPVSGAKDRRIWGGEQVLLSILPLSTLMTLGTLRESAAVTKSVFSGLVPTEPSNKETRKRYYYFFYRSVSFVGVL